MKGIAGLLLVTVISLQVSAASKCRTIDFMVQEKASSTSIEKEASRLQMLKLKALMVDFCGIKKDRCSLKSLPPAKGYESMIASGATADISRIKVCGVKKFVEEFRHKFLPPMAIKNISKKAFGKLRRGEARWTRLADKIDGDIKQRNRIQSIRASASN